MNFDLSTYFPSFRGPLRSADFNDAFKEIADFLGISVKLVQRLHRKDSTFRTALNYDLLAMEQFTTDLETQQDTLNTSAKTLFRSFSNGTGLSSDGTNTLAQVDSAYGILHLPIVYTNSFIPEVEDEWGDMIPDPNVDVYVDDVLAVQESSTRNIISRSMDDLWIEASNDPGNRTIRIVFPRAPQIAPNYMVLSPLPIYKESIGSVQFKTFGGSYSSPYTGFPTSIIQRKKYYFGASSFKDEARFTITPWLINSKYVYGMRNFDIGYTSFAVKGVARFTMSNSEAINNIIGISHSPVNGSFVKPGPASFGFLDAEPVIIRIYSNSGYSNLLWDNIYYSYPSDASPISVGGGTSLYVEVEINKVSDTTPVLENLTVAYN